MRNEGSFVDLRQWIDLLEREGELHRITAPVSWDREIGTVSRKVQERKGPALLFENIRGYEKTRGRRVFTGGIGTRERLALALGFPKHTSNREIVQYVMKKNRERIPPVRVATGPVKENIVKGDAIDLLEFPVPKWHYLEGGRYINTYACIVTKDPDTGVQNVGIYRGMVGRKNSIPSLLILGGQHWGQHFAKYAGLKQKMPVACVIGWDPIMGFLAGSPLPAGVCEFDVLGAYRDAPVPVVRCETVDLEVPASAEIVIEGLIDPDPANYEIEGPFAEFTGYVSDLPTPRPTIGGDLHHPPQRPDTAGHAGGQHAQFLQRERRDLLGTARRHRLEHPDRRGHPGCARHLRRPDHLRDQHLHQDPQAISGTAEADRGGTMGRRRWAGALQARVRVRGGHRRHVIRANGLGYRLPRQRRPRWHRDFPRPARACARPFNAT